MKKETKKLLEQFVRTKTPKKLALTSICFKEQLAFVQDPHPFTTAVCSRRAGKSTSCAADLLATAQSKPNTVCLYITITRTQAQRNFWPILKNMVKQYELGAIPNESNLSLKMPNNSLIYCLGANDQRQIEKLLGMPILKVYIDEGQSFPHYLIDLIDRILAPALLDYAGKIRLIGTPGCVPAGPFWDLSQSKGWSHHTWTFFDNPHIPLKSGTTHSALLQRELDRRSITVQEPSIRRDYYGEWQVDTNSLVLHYNKLVNGYAQLPKNLVYILGVDLGFNDADALAVLAWSDDSPDTFLVEEKVTRKQSITDLVGQIEQLRSKYPISKITIDAGGLGKKIAEELLRRHQIPVEAADKTQKIANYAFLNDALRTGKFKAKEQSTFADDCHKLEWDWDKSTPEKKMVSNRFHSDIIDAVLYAFKLSPAFAFQTKPEPIKYGSKEWATKEEEMMFEQELQKAQEAIADVQEASEALFGGRKWEP